VDPQSDGNVPLLMGTRAPATRKAERPWHGMKALFAWLSFQKASALYNDENSNLDASTTTAAARRQSLSSNCSGVESLADLASLKESSTIAGPSWFSGRRASAPPAIQPPLRRSSEQLVPAAPAFLLASLRFGSVRLDKERKQQGVADELRSLAPVRHHSHFADYGSGYTNLSTALPSALPIGTTGVGAYAGDGVPMARTSVLTGRLGPGPASSAASGKVYTTVDSGNGSQRRRRNTSDIFNLEVPERNQDWINSGIKEFSTEGKAQDIAQPFDGEVSTNGKVGAYSATRTGNLDGESSHFDDARRTGRGERAMLLGSQSSKVTAVPNRTDPSAQPPSPPSQPLQPSAAHTWLKKRRVSVATVNADRLRKIAIETDAMEARVKLAAIWQCFLEAEAAAAAVRQHCSEAKAAVREAMGCLEELQAKIIAWVDVGYHDCRSGQQNEGAP
ncbi:hypothetical protein HK405_013508, partial [Cladochytrium tenue]